MGATLCSEDIPYPREVTVFPNSPPHQQPTFQIIRNLSIRFGHVELIKLSKTNYQIILPIGSQLVTLQCSILKTLSEIQSYPNTKIKLTSLIESPIIDIFDPSTMQYYHKATLEQYDQSRLAAKYSVKVYPFTSYQHDSMKNALYQLSIYNSMSKQLLKDYFIIERGSPMSLVMIFDRYECSLFDVLMYRHLASNPWMMGEQMYLVEQLIEGYRQLSINMIAHRDIRASKIFLKSKNQGKKTVFDKYQIVNLQSSRKMNPSEVTDSNNLLLSTRGVPYFTQGKVKQLLNDHQEIGKYNHQMNDRLALVRLICSIVLLNPYQKRIEVKNQSPDINIVCQLLLNEHCTIEAVSHRISELASKYKSDHMYGILNDDYNISQILSKQLILNSQKEKIKATYIESLILLHQTNTFLHILNSQMDQNQAKKMTAKNVQILHRIALYYQGIDAHPNPYFQNQINLLVNLSEAERIHGIYNEANNYIETAIEVQSKYLSFPNKTSLLMAQLYREAAYNQINYKNDNLKAKQLIHKALVYGAKQNNIPISAQLKLIQAAGVIERYHDQHTLAAEQLFEKGLDLSSNRTNFSSQEQMITFQSIFQFWMGTTLSQRIQTDKQLINSNQLPISQSTLYNPKNIGKAQTYLKSALKGFQKISNYTMYQCQCLNQLGQLYQKLMDNQIESVKCYERTKILLNSIMDRKVSIKFKKNILLKLQNLYEITKQNYRQKQIQESLKQLDNQRMVQSSVRKPMKFGNDKNSTKKKRNNFKGMIEEKSPEEEDQDYNHQQYFVQ